MTPPDRFEQPERSDHRSDHRSERPARPPLPGQAWGIPVLTLLLQLVLLLDNGVRPVDDLLPLSMLLTAVVVVWVSRGVLAGRTVRLVLVLVLYGAATTSYAWVVLVGPDRAGAAVRLLLALATLGAVLALVRSPFHRWQREHHDLEGAPVGGILALAAVVGVLGPLAVPDEPRIRVEVQVAPQSHPGPAADRR